MQLRYPCSESFQQCPLNIFIFYLFRGKNLRPSSAMRLLIVATALYYWSRWEIWKRIFVYIGPELSCIHSVFPLSVSSSSPLIQQHSKKNVIQQRRLAWVIQSTKQQTDSARLWGLWNKYNKIKFKIFLISLFLSRFGVSLTLTMLRRYTWRQQQVSQSISSCCMCLR